MVVRFVDIGGNVDHHRSLCSTENVVEWTVYLGDLYLMYTMLKANFVHVASMFVLKRLREKTFV